MPTGRTPLRVLVVEDDESVARLLDMALTSKGYDVRMTPDGRTALGVASEFQPEVVLLDIGLPVMDGYELAERLRTLPGMDAVRIVAITGYGERANQRRSRVAGFDRHLVKPIDLDVLDRILAAFDPDLAPPR
jgi:two-component system CheB/CheR fusion protein